MPVLLDDDRFTVPLYTVTQASRYLQLPRATLGTWTDGYERHGGDGYGLRSTAAQAVVTALPRRRRGYPRLPFVGIAEAYVLSVFRRAGVPMQRIRPSVEWLLEHVGPHALASERLYTDGAEVLWNFAQQAGHGSAEEAAVKQLVVPRSGQHVFQEVVRGYLKQVRFASDGFADQVRLPQFERANVVLDARRSFGQPIFADSGVKLADALGPLRAGESLRAVSKDYGVAEHQLRDALSLTA